jgi:GTPase SAR1 family protein
LEEGAMDEGHARSTEDFEHELAFSRVQLNNVASKQQTTAAMTSMRLCDRLKDRSVKVPDKVTREENIDIYRPERQEIMKSHGFRKYAIGVERVEDITEKVILMVGGTGSGKTTLINSMLNYLYDVKSSDPFRFKLITEADELEEAGGNFVDGKSRTKNVSAFELCGTNKPYRITLVDTPGFGDPDGIQRDQMTIACIKQWFQRGGTEGMATINAICIVVQNTQVRLTANLRHELTSVVALFGADMKESIVIMFTFCDGQKPPAHEGLRAADIPVPIFFKFNNSAVFDGRLVHRNEIGEDGEIQEMFWKTGMRSFDNFFKDGLEKLPAKSLIMSVDVLRSREQLEKQAFVLSEQMQNGINKVHQISEHIAVAIRSHEKLEKQELALNNQKQIADKKAN